VFPFRVFKRDNVAGAEIEMRWHEEPSFENGEMAGTRFLRSADVGTATGKQDPVSGLSIRRTLKSVNKYRGSLDVAVTNNRGGDIQTRYLETIPWFVQMFLHTQRVKCNGTSRGSDPFYATRWNVLTVRLTPV
jgi:hypothetical protein